MYHVKITDDTGRVVTESDGDALLLSHHASDMGGVHCVTLSDGASTESLFEIVLGADKLITDLLEKNHALKIMYLLQDEIVENRTEIDMTRLAEALADD